jgi:cell division cycle 14
LKGLDLAINLGWYKFKEFDPREYEYYEKVENGDLNWIIPGKFIAFMGPVDNKRESRGNCPEDYLQVFRHFGVSHVVRLNEVKYDRQKFVRNGVKHTDLFFIDGSTPSEVSYFN